MEALIDSETLITGLEKKGDQLPEELKKLVGTVVFAVEEKIKVEGDPMPVITGNLQGSITNAGSDFERRIYPDEGIAPYAYYVLKGIRGKAKVAENDFMGIGFSNAQDDIDNAVEEFKSWLLE